MLEEIWKYSDKQLYGRLFRPAIFICRVLGYPPSQRAHLAIEGEHYYLPTRAK